MSDSGAARPTVDEFVVQLERVADRLRSLGESRLTRPGADGGPSVAEQAGATARAWAQVLDPAAAELMATVSPFGVGDQLLVLGRALAAHWRDGTLTSADQTEAWDAVEALRRAT